MTMTSERAPHAETVEGIRSARRNSALQVVRKAHIADAVVELTLADPAGKRLAPWTPGSHIDLILPTGAVRQYSLCGDRWDGFTYTVAVLREEDGRGGSAWIHDELQTGTVLEFGGPRNQFPMIPATEYLFIAGGIGITPFRPMVTQAAQTGVAWRLLYGGRRLETMAYATELVSEYGDQVTLFPHDELGLPDIPAWIGTPQIGARIFTCGPVGLIEAVGNACRAWNPHHVRSERFVAADAHDSLDKPFDIELARTGETLHVSAGQSILDALNVAGRSVLSSCRMGTCGTCEVRVLAGSPDHRDSVLNETDRIAGDCIITCVSRTSGDRLVLDM